MAISAAICNSFKQEILQGVHTSGDIYKIALYTSAASLGASTTGYSATDEVSGTGYSAGGAVLSGFSVSLSGATAILDFTSDPSWSNATLTARGALIYNSTRSNKAVMVLNFVSDYSCTNGTFTVVFPAADASNGLLRIA